MRTITIPLELMLSTNVSWDIDWRGQSSGESNAGSRQIVYNAFPRWVGKPKLALEGQQIAEWRAIRARAQGRRGVYRVPMVDPLSFDYGSLRKDILQQGIPNVNNNTFSTGKGMAYAPFWRVSPEPPGVMDTNNEGYVPSAGDQQIWIDASDLDSKPKIGGIYSIRDYPFVVVEAFRFDEMVDINRYIDNSQMGSDETYRMLTSLYRITVEMPLRIDLSADDVVSTIPFGLFFAEKDETGRITYGGTQYAEPEFSFVEWVR